MEDKIFFLAIPGYLENTGDYSRSGELPPSWSKYRTCPIMASNEDEAIEILIEDFYDGHDEEDCHLKIKPQFFTTGRKMPCKLKSQAMTQPF